MLRDLGTVVKLGHRGDICVVRMNGIQNARVKCDLQEKNAECNQMLDVGLWPATRTMPCAVFSQGVLDHFVLLTTQGNVTAQDFMRTLERLTW